MLSNFVCLCNIMRQSVMQEKKIVCYLQGQAHSKGSYAENMSLSTISSELLIPWQPDLVWYLVISQSVLWKKLGYCIQSQGCSERSKCQCLSGWCLLNRQTFCYQTWQCDASLWAGEHANRLVWYVQGQGCSKGSYGQNKTVSSISSEWLILFLPNLVW